MTILFSKQYRYVTNHVNFYVTNCYIFCSQLASYCLLCALVLSMWIPPQIQNLQLVSYVTNQCWSQRPIFVELSFQAVILNVVKWSSSLGILPRFYENLDSCEQGGKQVNLSSKLQGCITNLKAKQTKLCVEKTKGSNIDQDETKQTKCEIKKLTAGNRDKWSRKNYIYHKKLKLGITNQ